LQGDTEHVTFKPTGQVPQYCK